MPAVGGFVFDSSGAPADREIRVYRRDTGDLLGKTRSSGGDGDPHFDKVALLLHFDGGLHDETGRVWTGNDAFSYVGGRFGFGFTSGGGWVSTPTIPDLNLSTGDFTIECFMDLTGTSGLRALLSSGVQKWEPGNVYILVDSTNRLEIGSFEGGHIWISSAALPSSGTFHFCLERLAGELRLLVEGVLVDSKLSGAELNFSTSGTRIGVNSETDNPFSGVIDELRITKGVARYTANFTPPTTPFQDTRGPGRPLAFGEYYFTTPYTGEVQVVCLDDASAPLENDLILRTFPV